MMVCSVICNITLFLLNFIYSPFQEPATRTLNNIIDMHNDLMGILIFVATLVASLLLVIV